MAEFVMPILGADMEDGTLVEWHKAPGDTVRHGDIIADVETEKGLIEVEIFIDGIVDRILVAPGTKVPVGTVLAVIREEKVAGERETGTAPAAAATSPAAPEAPSAERRPAAPPSIPGGVSEPAPAPVPGETRLRISPAARRLAAELGVDLAGMSGSGPDGAIQLEDVRRAAAASAAVTAEPALRMRQTIAAAMARSKREIPHYYLATTIDMQPALAWLGEQNTRRPVTGRLLPGVLLLKAVALALREVPELNGTWDGQPRPRKAIHVGVAISLRQGGLIAPALHDTDSLGLDDLMAKLRDLVERARAGRLRSSELSDPTITVTNLGDQGVDSVFGVIYPPQLAIVGFGKIVTRPWCVDGQVSPRPVVQATLSADHRASDGHRSGRFLAALDRLLSRPEAL